MDGGLRSPPGRGIPGIGGVTEGTLPESDVTYRYVQVTGLPLELVKRRVLDLAAPMGVEMPAV
jgi:hypothetical protein